MRQLVAAFLRILESLLRGMATKERLGELTSDSAALKGALTLEGELPTLGESVATEELRKRDEIVSFARAQLGEPYVFGAEGPADLDLDRWDCSELVEHAYASAGLPMPDGSKYQMEFCQRVAEPRPGDIAYFRPWPTGVGHVVLYAGDGVCIEARGKPIGKVRTAPQYEIEGHARFDGWFRHPEFARPKEDRL